MSAPPNDAPVTVIKEIDPEDWVEFMAFIGRAVKDALGKGEISAALASTPAGNGVEDEYTYDELWQAIADATRIKGGAIAISVKAFRDSIRATGSAAALARPRAAVGERERARHIETLKWLKSGYLPGGPRDVWGACQAGINALQSPPAKVEG